jgi:hypothetical protein
MAFSEEVLWFFSISHFAAASLRENQDMVQTGEKANVNRQSQKEGSFRASRVLLSSAL